MRTRLARSLCKGLDVFDLSYPGLLDKNTSTLAALSVPRTHLVMPLGVCTNQLAVGRALKS